MTRRELIEGNKAMPVRIRTLMIVVVAVAILMCGATLSDRAGLLGIYILFLSTSFVILLNARLVSMAVRVVRRHKENEKGVA